MEVICAVLAGLVLLILHVLTFYFIFGYVKRLIVCSKKIDALVTEVSAGVEIHEDSETGKVTYEDVYLVTFEYEYQGKKYHSNHQYSKHCMYIENTEAIIKINPHHPAESWTKGELKEIFLLSLSLPLYAFFDYLYYLIVFQHML